MAFKAQFSHIISYENRQRDNLEYPLIAQKWQETI